MGGGLIFRRTDARLTRLHEEQVPGAARLAFLITGDRSLAEDLAHEAFMRVARKWEDIRHPAAVSGYMRTTVVNLARSHSGTPRSSAATSSGSAPRDSRPRWTRPIPSREKSSSPSWVACR